MGHLTIRSYASLQKRMDQFVPGIFDSEYLYEILKIIFTDEEAKLCSVMPLTYFSLKKIAKIWRKTEDEARTILGTLADKGLVYDFKEGGSHKFLLAPPVLGFFEFSLMRLDGRFDRKKLSELYYQYINVDDGFIKKYSTLSPPITRVFAQEDALKDLTSEVLSYEKASSVIEAASCITVGTCFCRHKMEHLGKACKNPQEVCLTFNGVAEYVAEHGIARKISKAEAHKILDLCVSKGLVQIGDNKKNELIVICNCCGCCCDLLLAYKKLNFSHVISPSNYIARINDTTCKKCGTCQKMCPVGAISKVGDKFTIDKKICLGCAVCARFCETASCKMENRPEKIFVPADTIEWIALAAIDRGKVGNFIFDNQTSFTHKILRGLLNFILKLPPIKNALLNKQFIPRLLKALRHTKKYSESQKTPS